MTSRRNNQQAWFYMSSALLILIALCWEFYIQATGNNGASEPFFSPSYIVHIIAAGGLIGAGLMSQRAVLPAARIASIISLLSLILLAIRACFLLIYLLLYPVSWGYIVPLIVLAYTLGYSHHVTSRKESASLVSEWLWGPEPGTRIMTSIALAFMVFSLTFVLFRNIVVNTSIESYRVRLIDEAGASRPNEVVIEFLDHPCYRLYAESPTLHHYISSVPADGVDMVIERRLVLGGAWIYDVQRIGDWNEVAEYHGLQLVVRMKPNSNERPNCASRPPFNGPYQIESEG